MHYFLLGLAIAALVTIYILANEIRRSLSARQWPKQPALVLESTVTRRLIRFGYLYHIRVRYEYTAGGRREQICLLPSRFGTDREGYATRLLNHFRKGASVAVHVNPENPEQSMLLPGVDEREWLFLSLMIIVALYALGAFIWL